MDFAELVFATDLSTSLITSRGSYPPYPTNEQEPVFRTEFREAFETRHDALSMTPLMRGKNNLHKRVDFFMAPTSNSQEQLSDFSDARSKGVVHLHAVASSSNFGHGMPTRLDQQPSMIEEEIEGTHGTAQDRFEHIYQVRVDPLREIDKIDTKNESFFTCTNLH